MTQPIDVAYVEIVAQTKDFRKQVTQDVDKALKDVEKRSDSTGNLIGKVFKDAGESAGEALSSGFKTASKAGQSLTGVLVGMTGIVGQLASTGPVGIAILAAAFVALAGAVAIAAAAVQNLIAIASFATALLPGLILGAVAGFGILAVAINGVAEAFGEEAKAANAAGGAAVDNSRRIADAQRGILQAQKDLIKAREEERERIQDVNRELVAARTREKRLADDVLKAQFALDEAKRIGTPRAQIEAQLALEEANAALAEGKDKTQDLAAEKAKADKNGVEGSERVQRALEALRDAQDALAAAQQKVSAGSVGQKRAIDSLSESAQAFVRALIRAKEELAPLATAIQETFFSGTAPLIDPIVENIKELQPEILRVAAAFNGIFKEILKFLGSEEAENAFRGVLNGLASFLETITPAIKPLLDAFGSLAGDSGEFGETLGNVVLKALLALADFVKNVDLNKLFEDAKEAIKELAPLLPPTLSILKSLFVIIAALGQTGLPLLEGALRGAAVAFQFAEDTLVPLFQKLEDFIKLVRDDPGKAFEIFKQAVKDTIDNAIESFDRLLTNVSDTIDDIKKFIKDLPENIKKFGPKFLEAGKTLIKKFFEGLGEAAGFLGEIGKKIANSVIKFINRSVIGNINEGLDNLEKRINDLPFFDSVNLPNIPNIPQLESGGLIVKDSLFRGGEKGKDEAVLPLTNSAVMAKIGNAIAQAGGAGGGGVTFEAGAVMINFNGVVPTEAEALRTGQAVANGIASRLAARNLRVGVRTM